MTILFCILLTLALTFGCGFSSCLAGQCLKVLNSLVVELVSDKFAADKPVVPYREWTFTNPYEGWVFISSSARVGDSGGVRVSIDSISKEKAIIVHGSKSRGTLEAMRYLSRGKHVLRAWMEGKSSIGRVIVRSILELSYCWYPERPLVPDPAYPRYDWDFCKKHLFPNMNCIISYDARGNTNLGHYRSDIQEWKRQHKGWISLAFLPGLNAGPIEQAAQYWSEQPGMRHPIMDGIIVDEFFMQPDDPRYSTWAAAIDDIYRDGGANSKLIYAYSGKLCGDRGYSRDGTPAKRFADTITKCSNS